ncbi:hypothetical protein [Paenibacillus endoradicis]|uniref:hypothetical protein n=1 Tax=Paenibacillus endoradicis TaxID=2972487 RepID=UPI0021595E84|nr:hypothetical protein [Paenibacillus endoradicis]MCR8660351.1 hypothetical protein [Paenibacillus endoradicis]
MTNEMTVHLSLNEATLQFVNFYAENELDTIEIQTHTLQEIFRSSAYYNKRYESDNNLAVGKAISFALNRSEHWQRVRIGLYRNLIIEPNESYDEVEEDIVPEVDDTTQLNLPSTDFRNGLIEFLTSRMFDLLKIHMNTEDIFNGIPRMSAHEISSNLYLLTESYYKQQKLPYQKFKMGDYISEEAMMFAGLKGWKKQLVFEYMVPKNLYINEFIKLTANNELTPSIIQDRLQRYYYVCIVSTAEYERLDPFVMGEGWDGRNPFYRYEQANIRYVGQER